MINVGARQELELPLVSVLPHRCIDWGAAIGPKGGGPTISAGLTVGSGVVLLGS